MIIRHRVRYAFVWICLASGMILAHPVQACDVPVFRYALERWPSDRYQITVFYRTPLQADDKALVKSLENSASPDRAYPNCEVNLIDLMNPSENSPQPASLPRAASGSPWVVVRYPRSSPTEGIVWSGRLTADVPNALLDSPIRSEVATRILAGESSVWILLESGNSDKDNRAAAVLENNLKQIENTLTLPPQAYEIPDQSLAAEPTKEELRIAFSMIRLSRKNPKEQFLVNMLFHSEEDLVDYASQPMAFPIYGRGRVLYALVGEGITPENIREACEFLVGPCSCQVKALNPGTDLLTSVDWDASIETGFVSAWEMSTAIGSPGPGASASRQVSSTTAENLPTNPDMNPALRNAFFILAIIVIANLFLAFWIFRRRSQ